MALRASNLNSANARKQKKSVEETFSKLSQLEHILLRPDTYIGSAERVEQTVWVWDDETGAMVNKQVVYPPGLYKIFDEILVNAADHKQRDPSMNSIKVEIDPENQLISVWNNGAGIPVEIHKKEKVYVPELIFGHLLTSSNYDDDEKKTVGGRNGFGAKLANIFSTEFIIETADAENRKRYKQVFRNNMNDRDDPIIRPNPKKESYTKVSFTPELSRFGMTHLDEDIVSLMKKRVYDIAGVNPGLKIFLNGSKVPIKSFKDYVDLYIQSDTSQVIHERLNDRWEVAITASDGQMGQVSFVNSIWTIKGGTHVNNVADQVVTRIAEHISKKEKGLKVKPFQIKSHLSLFVNCLVENPSFDSQTKETLTTKPAKFGSKWSVSDDFGKKIMKSGIVENVLAFAKFKQSKELSKTDGGKKARVVGIPKLDDANKAGGRDASKCTLILTEGDSAKALAISGLSVVGRDYYGVFPLRGKLLNVREAKHKQIMDNAEINNLKKILGLQHGKKYTDDAVKSLRYGHVLIMADQDHDGSHIKGLVINFFDHFWPGLLQVDGFLQEFITPIVKCVKGKQDKVFFTMPEYRRWISTDGDEAKRWKPKYYKGLGTSTAAEAKTYFSNLPRHLHEFCYGGEEDSDSLQLAFSKQRINDRKQWLSSFVPGTFFNHEEDELNYSNFVNKELILFSIADNSRSIPSVIDGLKPSQRKVLYCCFKRNLTKSEIKVVQLAGYVSEHSAYHHGEASLQATIVGLAQNFTGSNNVNLLVPSGQFGTRLQGGKDAASSRYIFTKLAPISRVLFQLHDDPLLKYQEEDGMRIEPDWYCPVIPIVLVNGSEGIGTGWSSSVPCYNPSDIIANIRRLLNEEPLKPMHPWYRGFRGSIVPVENAKSYDVYGTLRKGSADSSFVVSELPIRSWTTPYKEFLEASMVGNSDAKQPFIKDLQDNSTENNVRFSFTASGEGATILSTTAAYKRLKLNSSLSTNNMVLFDSEGRIRRYETPEEIMQEFFTVRYTLYSERRKYLLKQLEEELLCLDNKQRFIQMVIDGKLKVAKRRREELLSDLKRLKFDPVYKKNPKARESLEVEEVDDEDGAVTKESGYDYLLSMALWSLTAEKVKQLRDQRENKAREKDGMESSSPRELWESDLDDLETALKKEDDVSKKMAVEMESAAKKARQKQRGGNKSRSRGKKASPVYEEEDADETLECIPIPSVRVVLSKKAPAKKAVAESGGSKVRSRAPAKKASAKATREKIMSDDDMVDIVENDDGSDAFSVYSDDGDEISAKLADVVLDSDEDSQLIGRRKRPLKKSVLTLQAGNSDDTDLEADTTAATHTRKSVIAKPKVVATFSLQGEDSEDDEETMSLSERLAKRLSVKQVVEKKGKSDDSEETIGKSKKPVATKRRRCQKEKTKSLSIVISPSPSPRTKKTRVKSPNKGKSKSKAKVKGNDGSSTEEVLEEVVEVVSRPRRSAARRVILEESEDENGNDSEDDNDDDSDFIDLVDDDSDFE